MENMTKVHVRIVNGKKQLTIPEGMTGRQLSKWIKENKDVLKAGTSPDAGADDDDSDSIRRP